MASEAVTAEAPAEVKQKDKVASVAGQIAKLSTGDRAALRRIYLTRSYEADGVVQGLLFKAGLPGVMDANAFAPWRLLAHVAALLTGTDGKTAHVSDGRLGRALCEAGLSENRFMRLTAARGPALDAQIRRAASMLAQKRMSPVDLRPILDLTSGDAETAERTRIRIAQAFFAAKAAAA